MTPGLALARAAGEFVGCPFRANGRDTSRGLDCVGLLEASLKRIGRPCSLPVGYRLRTADWAGLGKTAEQLGFAPSDARLQPGDVWVCRPSPMQLHFVIVGEAGAGFIEAHAGLRRVVVTPAPYPHPVAARWRLLPET